MQINFDNPLTIPKKYICQDKIDNALRGQDITLEGIGINNINKISLVANSITMSSLLVVKKEFLGELFKWNKQNDEYCIEIIYSNSNKDIIMIAPFFIFVFVFKKPLFLLGHIYRCANYTCHYLIDTMRVNFFLKDNDGGEESVFYLTLPQNFRFQQDLKNRGLTQKDNTFLFNESFGFIITQDKVELGIFE